MRCPVKGLGLFSTTVSPTVSPLIQWAKSYPLERRVMSSVSSPVEGDTLINSSRFARLYRSTVSGRPVNGEASDMV